MKRCLLFVFLLPLLPMQAQDLLSPDSAVTLDPAAYAEVRGQMKGLPTGAAAAAGEEAAAWRAAANAPTPEERAVRLLVLLQRMNPTVSAAEQVGLYAEALALHNRALQGEPAARAQLAAALRSGVLPCGLRLPQDAASADKLEGKSVF